MYPPFYSTSGAHTRNNSLSSAVTLTAPAGASYLLIQALGANVRFTLDGSTPTAASGFQLKAGDPPLLITVRLGGGANVLNAKVIQESSGAEVQYQFLG